SRYLQNAPDDYTQAATAPRSGNDRVFLLRQRKGPAPLRHANPAISAVTIDYRGCSIVMPCMTPVGPMYEICVDTARGGVAPQTNRGLNVNALVVPARMRLELNCDVRRGLGNVTIGPPRC